MRINLACGDDYKEGWVNVDYRDNVKIDVKHDLNKFPYPFKNGSKNFGADVCYIRNAIDCLNSPIKTIKEMARITKTGGEVIIHSPHALSYAYLSGLEHQHHFTENTFNDYTMKEFQMDKILKLKEVRFVYVNQWKKYIPLKKWLKIFTRGIYDDIEFRFEVIR